MTAFKVDIQANIAEIEAAAKKSVEDHLEATLRYQIQTLVDNRVREYVAERVNAALDTPEVASILNSVVDRQVQSQVDKKVASLKKKLGGTP